MNEIISIKLNNISLYNFMTFNKFTTDSLINKRIIFIVGKNANGKSTLTSESIYYNLFGKSLRYNKLSDLISWDYKKGGAFVAISYVIETAKNNIDLTLTRFLTGTNKFKLVINNDTENILKNLSLIEKVPEFNKAIKKLIDINEQKFNLLYLKSPFSETLFETNSDLLSNITKANFINELRKDFSNTIKEIKLKKETIQETINKQNDLITSINKEFQSDKSAREQLQDNKNKLKEIINKITEIENLVKTVNNTNDKLKNKHNVLSNKLNKIIDKKSTLNSFILQTEEKIQHYESLIAQGKCPTCQQLIKGDIYSDDLTVLNTNLKKATASLTTVNDYYKQLVADISNIKEKTDKYYVKLQSFNNNLIKLSAIKSQLETIISNASLTEKNNETILTKIKHTIFELNEELSVLSTDLNVFDSIFKIMLNKRSEYINHFYNNKIRDFNLILQTILSQMTKGKFQQIKIRLDNKPVLNETTNYNALSTSERKFVDMSFVIAYIIFLATKMKFKTFILDEFFDNFDTENILHIYDIIYQLTIKHNLQIFITSNMTDYLFNYLNDKNNDIEFIDITSYKGAEIAIDNDLIQTAIDNNVTMLKPV